MYKETQREPREQDFEILEYDNVLKEFGNSLGFSRGRDTAEACQRFAEKTGWTAGNENKSLWAKYPICS
tara:strand:+ start:933 stop:1139 length:207 start_codon:yes stop_codon:yes gene_type:complete